MKKIKFGLYPQTKINDKNLIDLLNKLSGELPTKENFHKWISYKYYFEGKIDDNMFYIDITLNNEIYRGVLILSYRTFWITAESNADNSLQDDNGYFINKVYWFKFEPIEWQIIKETDKHLILLANHVLDSQTYDYSENGYSSLYINSSIRKWLTTTFYNLAFSDKEKTKIQTCEVDNSASSSGYKNSDFTCENTYDKIYLMSVNDIYNYFPDSRDRIKCPTDYAISQGCLYGRKYNACTWMLRSPHRYDNKYIHSLDYNGSPIHFDNVTNTDSGVVPSIKISLEK